jgi:hypothetical protein
MGLVDLSRQRRKQIILDLVTLLNIQPLQMDATQAMASNRINSS